MTGALNIQSADNALAYFKSTDANANIKFSDSNSSDINQVGVGAIGNHLTLIAGGDNRLSIDSTGAVTMPAQPAFQARLNGTTSNLAINTTHTLAFATEIFDNNSDFNSSTYTFTAPVTGKYMFGAVIYGGNLDTATRYYEAQIVTSNRVYYFIISSNALASDPLYFCLPISVLADMDAGDTALMKIHVDNTGTAQADLFNVSHFSGHLAC